MQGNVQGDATQTALLVGALEAFLVSDQGAQLLIGPQMDIKEDADLAVRYTMRNQIGGCRLQVDNVTGRIRMDQLDAAGLFELFIFAVDRDGANTIFHPETQANALRTANRALQNSSAEVFDSGGTGRPVGFMTMPRIDVGAGTVRTLTIADAGSRFRLQSATGFLELGTIGADAAVNCYVSAAVGVGAAVRIPAGATVRYYGGTDGQQDFVGAQDLFFDGGAAFTLIEFGANLFECWGGQLL